MATTSNYSYVLPAVGGDFETWGGLLNANWNDLDTDLKATNDAVAAVVASVTTTDANVETRVKKIGDTMTGALVLPSTEPVSNLHAVKKQYVDNGALAHASRYLFSTVTSGIADPTAGCIALNHASNGRLATIISVSATCTNVQSTPIFANFVDGVVIGLSRADRTIYYRVTSAVNNTTWYALNVVALHPTLNFAPPAASAVTLLTFLGYLKPEAAPAPPYTDYLITTWSTSSSETVAHGLGVAPSNVKVIFKCKNAVNGYGVGALLYSPSGSNNERVGYSVSANTTNVYFSTGPRIYYTPRGGIGDTGESLITSTNWDVLLRVWP